MGLTQERTRGGFSALLFGKKLNVDFTTNYMWCGCLRGCRLEATAGPSARHEDFPIWPFLDITNIQSSKSCTVLASALNILWRCLARSHAQTKDVLVQWQFASWEIRNLPMLPVSTKKSQKILCCKYILVSIQDILLPSSYTFALPESVQ